MNYADLHCHTNLSDSLFSVPELFRHAAKTRIRYLAVSDHNRLISESEYKKWSKLAQKHQITLVPGCKASTSYVSNDGSKSEVHINFLLYRPEACSHLKEIAAYNQNNNQPERVDKILDKLKSCGVNLNTTFEELRKGYRQSHIGRAVIGTELVRQGFACTKDEAFREFLNDKTGKAYVKNDFTYAALEDVLCAAREDQALAVLCHPLSYSNISDENGLYELLQRFKTALNGSPGALECEYRRYNRQQRDRLKELAAEFDLLVSCGSDSHGDHPSELDNRFHGSIYLKLLAEHKRYYVEG